jgi:hypothetical protein
MEERSGDTGKQAIMGMRISLQGRRKGRQGSKLLRGRDREGRIHNIPKQGDQRMAHGPKGEHITLRLQSPHASGKRHSTDKKIRCDYSIPPDSQINLGIPRIPSYCDKEYSASEARRINARMDKVPSNKPLTIDQIRRNTRVSRKRLFGERPYPVIKGIFHIGHVFVTMIRRVRVKAMFMCLVYNLFTPISMENLEKGTK